MPPIDYATYAVPRADLRQALVEFNARLTGFIATDVLPVWPVPQEAATISVVTRENLKRVDMAHKAGAGFPRIAITGEDLAYACADYGIEAQLTDRDRRKFALDFDAETHIVRVAHLKRLIEREVRAATLLMNGTTWAAGADFIDYSSYPWATTTTDVISQVNALKALVRTNTGQEPDSILMNQINLDRLLANTVISARFPGAPVITEAMIRSNLGAIFGLQNLYVGGRMYDSANPGQVFTGANIWSSVYVLVFKKYNRDLEEGGLGASICWQEFDRNADDVLQYREEQTESDIFRTRDYRQEKVFDHYFGALADVAA